MTSVFAEAVWFTRASMRNNARQLKSRLKSPRYALAFLVGALYFGFIFLMPLFLPKEARDAGGSGVILKLSRGIGGMAVAFFAASWWLWRSDMSGISLSPAEANLLVPAPLTRRQLIQFKLLRAQPSLMLSALIVSSVMHSSPMAWGFRYLSAWTLATTLQLHRYGASLVNTAVSENGKAGWRRVWLASAIFAAMLGAVLYSIVLTFIIRRTPFSMIALSDALSEPPAVYALAPFRAIIAPLNAVDLTQWKTAFAIAVLIVVAHYIWVIHTDAAFEEGAAAAGEKRAKFAEAVRAGRMDRARMVQKPVLTARRSWIPLPAGGEPAYAIFWKNVLAVTRGMSRRIFSTVLSLVIFATIFMTSQGANHGRTMLHSMGRMALVYSIMVTFMMPTRIRHDFRNDLRVFDLLRTLPIGGARLAAAEIATSAVLVSLTQAALIGFGVVALLVSHAINQPRLVALLAAPALLLVFGINATMIAVHNWVALTYPAWTRKPGGIEMFGVAMVGVLAGAILLVLILVGPALVAASATASIGFQWGHRAYIPAGAGFITGLYAQLFVAVWWVGRAYDRMDPVERTLIT